MLFVIGEIALYLVIAAVVGLFIGAALFGKRPAQGPSAADAARAKAEREALEAERAALASARSEAGARVSELERELERAQAQRSENEQAIAELRHQLDQAASYRVQAATEVDKHQQRVKTLEASLRRMDADMAASGGDAASATATADLRAKLAQREETITRLERDLAALQEASSADAPKVAEMQAEIKELRATLESAFAAPSVPTVGEGGDGEEHAALLREEITGLKAAYEAAERSLEEQEQQLREKADALTQSQRDLEEADGAVEQLTSSLMREQIKRAELEKRLADAQAAAARSLGGPPTPAQRDEDDDDDFFEADIGPESTLPGGPSFDFDGEFEVASPPVLESTPATVGVDAGANADGALGGPAVPDGAEAHGEAPADANAETTDGGDDLARIRGIDPGTAERLNEAGFRTWRQIADLDEAGVQAIAEAAKIPLDQIERDRWVEQAKALRGGE